MIYFPTGRGGWLLSVRLMKNSAEVSRVVVMLGVSIRTVFSGVIIVISSIRFPIYVPQYGFVCLSSTMDLPLEDSLSRDRLIRYINCLGSPYITLLVSFRLYHSYGIPTQDTTML